ncbi:hypothetical protein [Actinomadura napierensis]|uniref:Uncharacterized protein n=1 Tax=Actinomadura napierensis TaxID=267854 RepID=A0ABN3AEP9_9ACTN
MAFAEAMAGPAPRALSNSTVYLCGSLGAGLGGCAINSISPGTNFRSSPEPA